MNERKYRLKRMINSRTTRIFAGKASVTIAHGARAFSWRALRHPKTKYLNKTVNLGYETIYVNIMNSVQSYPTSGVLWGTATAAGATVCTRSSPSLIWPTLSLFLSSPPQYKLIQVRSGSTGVLHNSNGSKITLSKMILEYIWQSPLCEFALMENVNCPALRNAANHRHSSWSLERFGQSEVF